MAYGGTCASTRTNYSSGDTTLPRRTNRNGWINAIANIATEIAFPAGKWNEYVDTDDEVTPHSFVVNSPRWCKKDPRADLCICYNDRRRRKERIKIKLRTTKKRQWLYMFGLDQEPSLSVEGHACSRWSVEPYHARRFRPAMPLCSGASARPCQRRR